ncbi:MAG TPA: diacylglycerol kinase family lipid kinase [Bacteroidales bacterium]|nr:diacylglycerol kinase family lipid kinase [Bacteroidales bacterium]HPS16951.1 diacylglycerol kinase family lipid kinase [Bacteroidales bacterium]
MSEQKKKIIFIINPISGIGRQVLVERAIKKFLDHSRFTYEIIKTEYAHHAIEISRKASLEKTDIVVAVGGDGSANDVACGLVNSETIMGLIPVGSGNGLAHHLKIPYLLKRSIGIINRQKVSRIDTATINDKLFISIAGLGFDALVAEEFAKSKRRGFFSYLINVVVQFFKYKPLQYKISFNNQSISCSALLVSFANSDQFGYNITIAPDARINDGYIDLCIIHPVSVFSAAFMANKLFLKNINRSKHVEIHKVKEAQIEVSDKVSCHIDGDPAERTNNVNIKIAPKSLNIIIP